MREQRKYVHEDKNTHKKLQIGTSFASLRVWSKVSVTRATLGKRNEIRKEDRSYIRLHMEVRFWVPV